MLRRIVLIVSESSIRYRLSQSNGSKSLWPLIFKYNQFCETIGIDDRDDNRPFDAYGVPRDQYVEQIRSVMKSNKVENVEENDADFSDQNALVSESMRRFFNNQAKIRREKKAANRPQHVTADELLREDPHFFHTVSKL